MGGSSKRWKKRGVDSIVYRVARSGLDGVVSYDCLVGCWVWVVVGGLLV